MPNILVHQRRWLAQGINFISTLVVFQILATGEFSYLARKLEDSERDTPQSIYALYPGKSNEVGQRFCIFLGIIVRVFWSFLTVIGG